MEAAGLALAIFPLVVKGVFSFVEATKTVEKLVRYHRELRRYARNLQNESVGFKLSIEQLVSDIAENHEEAAQLLADPGGSIWHEFTFKERLEQYLDHSYGAFDDTIQELLETLETIADKLDIDLETKSVLSIGIFKQQIKRFKIAFNEAEYKELFERVRKANDFLRRTTFQSKQLNPWRNSRHSKSKHSVVVSALRKHAKGLHKSMSAPHQWQCSCGYDHWLKFRLNGLKELVDAKSSDAVTFEMGIGRCKPQFSTTSNAVLSPETTWEDLLVDSEEQEDANNCFVQATTYDVKKIQVKFASIDLKLKTHNHTHRPRKNDPIGVICEALKSHQSGLATEALGYIKHDEMLQERYHVYRSQASTPKHRDLETLDHLLSQNSGPKLASIVGFSRRARLSSAACLAISVIILEGSWLRPTWTAKDILLLRNAKRIKNEFGTYFTQDELFLPWNLKREAQAEKARDYKLEDVMRAHRIRNVALFALGITLIELSLGESFENLVEDDDRDPDPIVTKRKTATRLIPRVADDSGYEYATVVERCLDCPFDLRDLSFDNQKFRDLAYESIVIPLTKDLAQFG